MRTQSLATVGLVLLAPGCVGSLQPTYLDSDIIYDAAELGVWEDSGSTAHAVVRQADATGYAITFTDEDGQTAEFTGHLARGSGFELFDVEPASLPRSLQETFRSHYSPLHSFFFVTRTAGRVALRIPDRDSLAAYLTHYPEAVAHVRRNDEVLLTAPPLVLRAFLETYRRRPGVLGDSLVWVRHRP